MVEDKKDKGNKKENVLLKCHKNRSEQ